MPERLRKTFSYADTRAEYRRILGFFEFNSARALLKFFFCAAVALVAATSMKGSTLGEAGSVSLGIVVLCGLLWMTEAIPAFAVALLAIGLQIALLGKPGGVLVPENETRGWEMFVEPWASPSMWLFFGGFVLARAAARTGLDRQLAGDLIRFAGASPGRVLLVAMVTTFFFSMFLSNTATAAMMLAILAPMLSGSGASPSSARAFTIGVAFAANIGGMGTIIGTPPNAIASGLLRDTHPVDFLTWMAYGLPPAILLLGGLWFALARKVRDADFSGGVPGILPNPDLPQNEELLGDETVPRWQRFEVLAVAGVTIILWLTGGWHGIPTAVVSFFPIVFLSITGVIRASDIRSLDWDILILLAGGLSLGVGVAESGLAEWIASKLSALTMPDWAMGMLFCLLTLMLSNFMSNTAAANILIPIGIAAGSALGGGAEAAAFAIPMSLSASAAMCLPISTPPNAIAYASGRIRARDFLLPGAIIGLIACVVSPLWCRLLLL